MLNTLVQFCRDNKVNVSREYLKNRLYTHPEYPSMWAVKETLAEFGVMVGGYVASPKEMLGLKRPFLLVGDTDNKDALLYFQNASKFDTYQKRNSLDRDFAILVFEERLVKSNQENERLYGQERINTVFQFFLLGFVVLYLLGYVLPQHGILFFLLQTLALLGIFTCWQLFNKENRYDTKIS